VRRTTRLLGLALLALALSSPAATAATPPNFFGIGPQTELTQADTDRMARGGFETVRLAIPWSFVQQSPSSGYDWSPVDHEMEVVARSGMSALPFIYSSPEWLVKKFTVLPVKTARQRKAWKAFLRAAVDRYGPNGSFWLEHGPGSPSPLPKRPVRRWQIWNEANFFFFATPASPGLYGRLVKIAHRALTARDPRAKVVLSGLFGRPKPAYPKGMPATRFLNKLYDVPGIRRAFDGVALHPYAATARELRKMTEALRKVIVSNRDRGAGLYLTEIGWGSQSNSPVAFERGPQGQVTELKAAYRYLIRNRRRLNVKSVYWFTWKDRLGSCSFCDSMGLFRAGPSFDPKPSWYALVKIMGGDPSMPPETPGTCPIPTVPC
jgi:hypothetical protein